MLEDLLSSGLFNLLEFILFNLYYLIYIKARRLVL
jgi:hypothetical protein